MPRIIESYMYQPLLGDFLGVEKDEAMSSGNEVGDTFYLVALFQ